MRKMRKGTQLKLTNPKNAGRPAIHDIGIRHIKRAEIRQATPLHLTIKLIRADIQNKIILKALRRAIMRARLQGMVIIHYSLEHDHVHLYAETSDNGTLARGMKALGVTLAKRINGYFKARGRCYKTRYHLRILKSASEVKNVLNYILKNGIKHKRTTQVIDPYNSAIVLHDFKLVGLKLNKAYIKKSSEFQILKSVLGEFTLFKKELRFV
jgi:Transposase IS200 like